jgi:hypothetical protein
MFLVSDQTEANDEHLLRTPSTKQPICFQRNFGPGQLAGLPRCSTDHYERQSNRALMDEMQPIALSTLPEGNRVAQWHCNFRSM